MGHSLVSLMRARKVGETVSLKILRDGKETAISVTPEERKQNALVFFMFGRRIELGL